MWLGRYLSWLKPNFGTVREGRIYRSAQPSRGDLLKYRERYKIQVVLNLRHDASEKERIDAEAVSLSYERVPMRDDVAPTDAQIRKALNVLQSGKVVLVHCKGGRHRAGVVVAVYRVVVDGWDKESAWDEAKDYGWYSHGGHAPIKEWFFAVDLKKFKIWEVPQWVD